MHFHFLSHVRILIKNISNCIMLLKTSHGPEGGAVGKNQAKIMEFSSKTRNELIKVRKGTERLREWEPASVCRVPVI